MKNNYDNLGARKIKAVVFSISTALFLAIFKTIIFVFSGSIALLASALDSFMDMMVSAVNFFAIRESEKPPDKEHSYGHGKIEAVAGFFQSLLVFASGSYLLYQSVLRLITPEEITHSFWGVLVMIVSIISTFLLSRYLEKEAKATKSLVLRTDRLHFTTDLWRDIAVIFSLIIIYFFGFYRADSLMGLIISFYICISALAILKESFDILVDKELPLAFRKKIIKEVKSFYPDIQGVHDLKTRKAGNDRFVEFHLEFKESMSLKKAHEISNKLTAKIQNREDKLHIMVHFDTHDDRGEDLK